MGRLRHASRRLARTSYLACVWLKLGPRHAGRDRANLEMARMGDWSSPTGLWPCGGGYEAENGQSGTYPEDMATKHPLPARNAMPLTVVESPVDAFKIGADVRAMQDEVRENNARYRRTNEHIIMASAAWHAYRKFRGR